MTIVWNEVTIWWNEVTKGWNEVAWNEVVMERSDRHSMVYTSSVKSSFVKPKQFLGSLDISKETPKTFNRFK